MSEPFCRSPLLLSAEESVLIVVDAQDKLLPLMSQTERLVWNLCRLVEAANVLSVPCLATEQYPEKLGPTTERVRQRMEANSACRDVPEKLTFSCAGCLPFLSMLRESGRRQVVLAGLETHVCVLQTAFDLTADGFDVSLVVDALGTRFIMDHDVALRRMEAAGMTLTTTEGVMFEWCERAGTDRFKKISQIVRQQPPNEPPL